MLEFEPSSKQKQLRDMTRWLAKEQVRPLALRADREGKVPRDFLLGIARMGIRQGARVDDEGEGTRSPTGERQTNRTSVLLSEEMAWADPAIVLSFPGPGLGGPPVRFMGTPEQRARFFNIFNDTNDIHYGAYALTEPGAGSDAKAIRTSAQRDGDTWVLNGRKVFITNGASADWVVVFATVDPALGRAGHRAFVVERGTPGFSVGRLESKMGLRASETAELVFEDCHVPHENLLGGDEHYARQEGFEGAMKTFDSTRPLVGIMAVGMARAVLEEVTRFVKEHTLERPIPRYRAIRDRIADGWRQVHAARLLCWRAAWMADLGHPNAKEASMAKAYAAQVAMRVCSDGVQLLGAHGALRDSIVEKFFRDIKVFDIFEGTGQIQRIVISKRIIPDLREF